MAKLHYRYEEKYVFLYESLQYVLGFSYSLSLSLLGTLKLNSL